ncbi:InlB B-repeat-containing protein [Bifidobacterium adolescentis]|uniref:InlB B-repeat-containing protein n=1 Tax=Bifidobacterium adolescentis TaxID=1680 RepID=UPI0034A1F538
MGFLTRLLAGLLAASTLGTGLTGTANAVDTNGATGTTKSVVKLTADDTNNLPDHIVNGSFDYPSVPSWTGLAGSSSNKNNKGKLFATINPGTGKYGSGCAMSTTGRAIPNWNRSSFAWNSTQGDAHYPGMSCEAGNVELNYDSVRHNQFAELTADQQGTAIYQDVKVAPGTMMTWSLKHSSATSAYVDKMQVMIGEPYKETAQEATRIASENGNKVGEKMTTISTPTTSDRADNKKWDTYSGTYLVPDGVTTVRFTFKSVASAEWYSGNDLDDIEFSRSYKLTYDKNSSDAAGEVPSNQRGKENTTQPAKTKTSGTVKTVADDTSGLPDHLVNGDFSVNYKDQWLTGGWNWTSITPDGKYLNSVRNWNDSATTWKTVNGWDKTKFGWSSTQKDGTDNIQHKAGAVEIQYDDRSDNVYAELCAYEKGTAIYQDIKTVPGTLYKIRLKHASLYSRYLDKMQVMVGAPGHEQAVEMTRTSVNGNGDKLNEKSTTIATKVSNTGEADRNHEDQWETYEGTYVIPEGQTVTRFTFKSVDSKNLEHGNLLDDIVFDKAYRLDYDKNSNEAAGSVPSNQRGRENTVQPAKSKTTGTVKTVVDTSDGLPTELVNGDFEYPGADVLSQDLRDKKRNWWGVSRKDKMVYESDNPTKWVSLPSTFDSDRFAWDSSEAGKTSGVQEGSSQWHTNEVELQRDSRTGNMYAELSPYQAQSSIRQYIHTTPGTLYKVRLKHASLSSEYLDKMQVMIGADGDEQPVRMTRVESQNGLDAIGESTASTTISTHASNKAEISWGSGLGYHSSRNHDGQWATYEGVYVATSDVTVFTFKSVDSPSFNTGNLLDDVVFTKAYKLTYDKNSADASGQVPSNQRGKENTTQPAKSKASGTVKTVADDTSNLPDHLVNGDFSVNYHDQWKDSFGGWTSIDPNAGKTLHATSLPNGFSWKWTAINGWDRSKFGWTSTQKAGSNVQQKANAVELQYDDSTADNVYAELCAYEAGTAIYQDIRTVPGTLYKVRLKHASLNSTYLDKMQVMIGTPGHEQPVEMTRTSVNGHGDKLNEKSTTIATKVTNGNNRHHADQWETYEGTYLIPDGQTTTRFTFKSIDSKQLDYGNVLDDIVFDKAYRLTYDKNSSDATGEVPSNQRGRENTTQPAKDKTSGSVKLVADDDVAEYAANGLPKQLVNSDFDHDWRNIVGQSRMSAKYNFANIDPAHGDVEVSGALNGKGEASKQWVHLNGFDASKFGWKSNQTDTRVDGRGGIVEIQRSRANDNMYAEITASQANTYLYQDIDTAHDYPTVYTVKLRYAHRSGTINSNEKIQILVGAPGHEQPVTMTRIASSKGNRIGEKSTTVNAPNTDGWLGSWDTFQGSVVVPAGQNVSRFTFKALGSIDGVSGNLIDDVQFKLAYRLSYDKNANDAYGQVPSDTTANTVKQAKTRTTGSVRTVAGRTDGKVSDLVQRTTTHEDGSVTVRTVDQSTDVVSGCQVYYPAGQRITLATMAKDDDCWDSSMLSRPGHTQLGWNQDRNATQAQAEVTMVEGGMAVYAVWVGNPVLTYDTNKPATWSGQMPSTPASVSVAYNTAVTDGSGWRAGDTTKIRGYRFLGWYTGPQDNAGLYDWTRPLTGNVTVYAHWQRLQANVVYNANGGTGSHANTTGWQYSDVTIPGDTSKSFTRDGYVFKGWSLKAGKADVVYKDGSQIPLQDKDITLYAQWQGIHENFTETGGISLPLLIAGGIGLLVMGVGSTVMLTRRMNGHGMPDGE